MSDLIDAYLGCRPDPPKTQLICESCGADHNVDRRCRWWCVTRYGLLIWLGISLCVGLAVLAIGRALQ